MEEREPEMKLPRDAFSVALRQLENNPGVEHVKSRVEVVDDYGRSETWTIDTYRSSIGVETALLQRLTADGSLRLVLHPKVMATLNRQHDSLTSKMRARGARQAVATKRAAGTAIGNNAGLEAARRARKAAKK